MDAAQRIETGPVALVGGGSSGIGRAAARALALAGHRVVITGRRDGTLQEAARAIAIETGAQVYGIVHDVSQPDTAGDLLDAVERSFAPPDVIVLNAGGPTPGRVGDLSNADWMAATALLLTGPLRLATLSLPGMAARGFGRIVAVTSTSVRDPDPGLAASTVLRAAFTAAAKLLSLEHAGKGVTVNCVAPGPTATARREEILRSRAAVTGRAIEALDDEDSAIVPAGRPGTPEEIAAAVAFLASPAASYINGTVLTVDGGKTRTI